MVGFAPPKQASVSTGRHQVRREASRLATYQAAPAGDTFRPSVKQPPPTTPDTAVDRGATPDWDTNLSQVLSRSPSHLEARLPRFRNRVPRLEQTPCPSIL
jgi:hypothetical protein